MTRVRENRPDDPVLISTIAPGRSQIRLAAAVVAILALALASIAPHASRPLANTEVLLPAYAAAVLVIELITTALLLALFHVKPSRAFLILAAGYLFSGALVVPWVLSFPGVFTGLGIDAGLQSTALVAALRRLGFPLFVLAYAVLPDRELQRRSVAPALAGMLAAVLAIVTLATWLIFANDQSLPVFMADARNVTALWAYIPGTAVALYLLGLGILAMRRRTILDLWLMVVLCTLLIEIIQISYLGSGIRLSVGWWAGRLYGLTSASIVLLVLLAETTAVYTRLARSVAAERRARQNRLTAMEALSASIAHEVNQPLASMVTNADAGLRWLEKAEPQLGEAKAALRRIVAEGHRANKVVSGIRTMFMKGTSERVQLDLNRLIEDTIRRSEVEARLGRVSLELGLDATLPPIVGNPVQLQQTISNLIDNAVEAMRTVGARQRALRIDTERMDHGEVMVSVADTGVGLQAADSDRIFEPFFTTKPDGMGMGLMFCRSTLEAHGGRLWASANSPRGTTFRFTLPAAMGAYPITEVVE